jgi:pimeloyl-ACP methyl ester carboxylesterase
MGRGREGPAARLQQQQGLSRLQALAPETERSLIAAFGRAYAARPNSCVLLAPRNAALMCSSHRKALPPGGHFLRRFTARKRNCLRAAAPSEQQIKRSAHSQVGRGRVSCLLPAAAAAGRGTPAGAMAPLLCAAVGVAVLALSLGFPWLAAYRDASFYRAPPELSLPGKFAADEAGWSVRRWRSGTVLVQHDAATLARVADEQGPSPAAPVRIAYRTTYAASTADGDSGGGSVGCDPFRHLLLVHGTGMLGDMYVWSAELLRGAGHEELAAALSPQLGHKSVAARVHDEPGFCVTTIDLRGHGRSASTAGPWSVELLAADIAAAVRLIHGEGVRVHVNGLSLGFGVALSLAFNYPSLVLSVSGGGFLADHRTDDWLPWLFSRPAIIRVMGVQVGVAYQPTPQPFPSCRALVIFIRTRTERSRA